MHPMLHTPFTRPAPLVKAPAAGHSLPQGERPFSNRRAVRLIGV